MKIFLGMLMVLIVSGEVEVTINGILGDDVLLPCHCKKRNLILDFRWQKEEPIPAVVFSNNTFNDSYKGRTEIFLSEDIFNCSLLLKNVTLDDQGKYKCSFFDEEMYIRPNINLNISAIFNCHVEAEGISANNSKCISVPGILQSIISINGTKCVSRCLSFKVIPVLLVLGFSLVLLGRWKLSQRHNTDENEAV